VTCKRLSDWFWDCIFDANLFAFPSPALHRGNFKRGAGCFTIKPSCTQIPESSARAEKYWAWALALNVEHAWGEQFAAALLNRLGPHAAIESIAENLPEPGRAAAEILDLRLR
jgi:hypothetical protein